MHSTSPHYDIVSQVTPQKLIAICSFRLLLCILPIRDYDLRPKGEELSIIIRDITKANIQSIPSKHLIVYKPPPEFFSVFPENTYHPWQSIRQLYGYVEAGGYWHHTFVPWLLQNILNSE